MSELNLLISSLGRWIFSLASGSAVGTAWRAPVRQAETVNQCAKSIGLCLCLNWIHSFPLLGGGFWRAM